MYHIVIRCNTAPFPQLYGWRATLVRATSFAWIATSLPRSRPRSPGSAPRAADRHLRQRHGVLRLVRAVPRHRLDRLDDVDLLAAPEDRVAAAEMVGRALGDEELAAVGVRPRVRHRHGAGRPAQARRGLVAEPVAGI